MNSKKRILIIDDSSYNRKSIADFFKDSSDIEVIGKASDGQEGLRLALNEKPDVITLDLEMPKLDGFAFLRLLMSSNPTAVIIISSHSNRENVFRALELGALDFISKPTILNTPEIHNIKNEVIRKVRSAIRYNVSALTALSSKAPSTGLHFVPFLGEDNSDKQDCNSAKKLIAIGASTGGPASITRIIGALPQNLDAAVAISQHMPAEFTATFAARLNKLSPLNVIEVQKRQKMLKGSVYIAPGDGDLLIINDGHNLYIDRSSPLKSSDYTPSIDKMLISAANAAGENLLAVILTGMGSDGTAGCQNVYQNKGSVVVESEDTAVIYGMPDSVIRSGVNVRIFPLDLIAGKIVNFAGRTNN